MIRGGAITVVIVTETIRVGRMITMIIMATIMVMAATRRITNALVIPLTGGLLSATL